MEQTTIKCMICILMNIIVKRSEITNFKLYQFVPAIFQTAEPILTGFSFSCKQFDCLITPLCFQKQKDFFVYLTLAKLRATVAKNHLEHDSFQTKIRSFWSNYDATDRHIYAVRLAKFITFFLCREHNILVYGRELVNKYRFTAQQLHVT